MQLRAKVIPGYGNAFISENGDNGEIKLVLLNQYISVANCPSHIEAKPITAMKQSTIPIRISFVVFFINFPSHVLMDQTYLRLLENGE